jgi:hypothetical protein
MGKESMLRECKVPALNGCAWENAGIVLVKP